MDHEDKNENGDEGNQEQKNQQEQPQEKHDLPKDQRYVHNHPKELVIDDPSHKVTTRSSIRYACNYSAFVLQIEPKTIDEAEKDWINSMQEELNQFERNNIWTLVSRLKDHPIIGTKGYIEINRMKMVI